MPQDPERKATLDTLRERMRALEAASPDPTVPCRSARLKQTPDASGADGATSVPQECVVSGDRAADPPAVSAPSADAANQAEDPRKQAYDRVVFLCSYRDYSREKMRKRLAREHIDSAAAEEALDRAVACGLIDDMRYGEALCAGRMHAGRGSQGIEAELWENHIDPASIEGWPEEYRVRYGSELSRALHQIAIHPPRSKRPRDSAYRRLVGKGFSPAIASEAAGIWWSAERDRAERA